MTANPRPDTEERIEKLSAEFHAVYVEEQKKQGGLQRWPQSYSELPENIKDLDRALARYVLKLLDEKERELESLKQRLDKMVAVAHDYDYERQRKEREIEELVGWKEKAIYFLENLKISEEDGKSELLNTHEFRELKEVLAKYSPAKGKTE